MSSVLQPTNHIPRKHEVTARNITNVCIIFTGRKYPTAVKKLMESIRSKHLTGIYIIIIIIKSQIKNKPLIK